MFAQVRPSAKIKQNWVVPLEIRIPFRRHALCSNSVCLQFLDSLVFSGCFFPCAWSCSQKAYKPSEVDECGSVTSTLALHPGNGPNFCRFPSQLLSSSLKSGQSVLPNSTLRWHWRLWAGFEILQLSLPWGLPEDFGSGQKKIQRQQIRSLTVFTKAGSNNYRNVTQREKEATCPSSFFFVQQRRWWTKVCWEGRKYE